MHHSTESKFKLIFRSKGRPTPRESVERMLLEYGRLSLPNCAYVGQWLKRINSLNVAVYASKCGKLERLFVDELAMQSGVSVRWLAVEKITSFSLWKMLLFGSTERLDDVDTVFVPNLFHTRALGNLSAEKSLVKMVSTDALVGLNSYAYLYRLIKRLHTLQLHGIQTQVLEMPVAYMVNNPSDWEQKMITTSRTLVGKKGRSLFPVSGIEEKYRDFYRNYRKYEFRHIRYKDYSVWTDFRSKCINIVDHIRPALDIPIGALRRVHIVGDSTAAGIYIMDEDLHISQLQRLINKLQTHKGETPLYSCVVYGNQGYVADMMQRRLRDIAVKQGDIIVIMGRGGYQFRSQEFKKSCEENGVPFYVTQGHYDRPHNFGEVFFDFYHLNPNGNRKTGEILFDRLFVNPQKLVVPATFQHYICGSVSLEHQSIETKDELFRSLNILSFIRDLEVFQRNSLLSGSAVMNCNPFTRGHLYLTEIAAAQVDRLWVFVVEEEKSEYLFVERFSLVKAGTKHLENVLTLPSSEFVISTVTFPEYFVKGQEPDVRVDASADISIFCASVAPALGLVSRFVGEEPFDRVTLRYNTEMQEMLPKCGLRLHITSRIELKKKPISASYVRTLLKQGRFQEVSAVVPETTMVFLRKKGLEVENG